MGYMTLIYLNSWGETFTCQRWAIVPQLVNGKSEVLYTKHDGVLLTHLSAALESKNQVTNVT
jgi:hypothetical protein